MVPCYPRFLPYCGLLSQHSEPKLPLLPMPNRSYLSQVEHIPETGGGAPQCQGRGCAELYLRADDGDNKVLLLETDYTSYVTFYMQNVKNGAVTHVLALYGNPTPVFLGIPAPGRGSLMGPRHIMEWYLGTHPPTQSPKFAHRAHPRA